MMEKEFENVRLARSEGICRITLSRPEKRNALSLSLMNELTGLLRLVGDLREDRVVILAAEGPVFSAGHDLGELRGGSIDDYRGIFDACVDLMNMVQSIPQPVIAEVHALATAAGCQLVATCDLVVASENATFATPGVRIGLFCSTPMVALSRAIGRKRALQMLLTGTPISARTAFEWGLVNQIAPDEKLKETTLELAHRIADASTATVGIGKQAFYRQIDVDQEEAYEYTKEVMSQNAVLEDAQEGIGAFLEKRKPCWKER